MSRSPTRLVICHKQLGDVLLLEPALSKLAAALEKPVRLVTRSGHEPLISLMKNVQYTGVPWLRRADEVFCYDELSKSALKSAMVFARRKALLLREDGECSALHRFVFSEIHAPGLGEQYVARYNWDHTDVPSTMGFQPPALQSPPAEWRPSWASSERYLLLNATAGWKRKRWQAGAWSRVLASLSETLGIRVLITSGNQDWQIEHTQKIAAKLGERAVFVGGQTRLQEYLWLVANAAMVVGVDGSAAHLAAAFGVKNLTLFFQTSPGNWHYPSQNSIALGTDQSRSAGTALPTETEVTESAIRLWQADV